MENRINIGTQTNPFYLYCKVSANGSDYCNFYNSSDECFRDIMPEIKAECVERGYNDDHTQRILDWYEIQLSNWDGAWCDIF